MQRVVFQAMSLPRALGPSRPVGDYRMMGVVVGSGFPATCPHGKNQKLFQDM